MIGPLDLSLLKVKVNAVVAERVKVYVLLVLISMHEDVEGFMYPYVDMQICVDCSLCEKVCPLSNSKKYHKVNTPSLLFKDAV
jgi:formate hydrogenlyase subunit 6/NADH:ubiquinone oxidoreductase subunit I